MKLRLFTKADIHDLWEWRNDEGTRLNSRETAPVELTTHEQWCARSLVNPDRTIFIAETGREKIGMIRFDRISGAPAFRISIIVAPGRRGGGHGRAMLEAGCKALLAQSGAAQIEAEIRSSTVASRRVFEACGFRFDETRADGAFLTYVRQNN